MKVYFAGPAYRLQDGLAANFVKLNPVFGVGKPQSIGKMPAYSLALPVRVGGEVDFFAFLYCLLKFLD